MASAIITQVDRDGKQVVSDRPKRGWFQRLCQCFSRDIVGAPMEGQALADTSESSSGNLLPALGPPLAGRKCLVIDLDETLVHSSFKPVPDVDFIVPVEIDSVVHNVYVQKRPGVDEFMKRMGALYEIVVFTASLGKYANPVLDLLDIHNVVHSRLFRESCVTYGGNYVKDLSRLGRDIRNVIIIDNSPTSYMLQPRNAVPIRSWFDDPKDIELYQLGDVLEAMTALPDVIPGLSELQEQMMATYSSSFAPHWGDAPFSFYNRQDKQALVRGDGQRG